MDAKEKMKHCAGCTENFYNGNNDIGVRECWMLRSARLKKKYRIGKWTSPTEPFAFEKVQVFDCRREKHRVFMDRLPDFITPEERKRIEAK